MTLQERINALANIGQIISDNTEDRQEALVRAQAQNPWFTTAFSEMALRNIADTMLQRDALERWATQYPEPEQTRTIGIVAAGNIPLVSFHDILCVLINGHQLQLKISEKDNSLILYILNIISKVSQELYKHIHVTERLSGFDAVIATGSNNTARYFEYYFGQYPHIIRKNRASVAILDGTESPAELEGLGHDIFDYYGLGCRNVSHLLVPNGYDFSPLIFALEPFSYLADHHKYRNNLDYQRTIYLMNQIPYLHSDHINIIESESLFSPVSCLHYHYYDSVDEVSSYLLSFRDELQCIVGHTPEANISFGETQRPGLSDYADHVDTMTFLSDLS